VPMLTADESLGHALLANGDRSAGLTQLDQAWDTYHQIGARRYRADVQRVMSDAGVRRRAKWAEAVTRPSTGWDSLTDAERRVAALIAHGHTNRSAATELGLSVNTIGTHLRLVFTKLGIQSRVQLANTLNAQGAANTGLDPRPLRLNAADPAAGQQRSSGAAMGVSVVVATEVPRVAEYRS
jgi:DNA-binding CsgD family transcriptional regulator